MSSALALRYPELKMIMAHMGHPWFEECAVVVAQAAERLCRDLGHLYRPWQFWNMMIAAQEYK